MKFILSYGLHVARILLRMYNMLRILGGLLEVFGDVSVGSLQAIVLWNTKATRARGTIHSSWAPT